MDAQDAQTTQHVDTQQYEQMQNTALAAFTAFEKIYRATNPPPEATRTSGLTPSAIITLIALTVVVIAAMIVSGSRTIPEFGSVGLAAFAMLEFGALVYAYRRAMHSQGDDSAFSRRLVRWGLAICVLVMLAGNIDATLREHDIAVDPMVKTVILLAVAVSAPVLTFIAGDILGMELVAITKRRDAAYEVYQQHLTGWRDGMMRSWDAQKSRMGVSLRVTKDAPALPIAPPALSEQTADRQADRRAPSGMSYTRDSSATMKALAWLETNPDRINDTLRNLEDAIGVGKDSISKAKKMMEARSAASAPKPDTM